MSVFEEACYLSNKRWVDSLPTEFEPVEYSKKHQRRMKTLFDKMRNGRYHRLTRRATAALIAAIIMMSMTITAFAIPASREYIIKHFFDHSLYTIVAPEQNIVDDIVIGYIPEGFEKTYEFKDDKMRIISYEADESWFDLRIMSLDQYIAFDTEYDAYEELVINGTNYIHYKSKNSEGYVWNDGTYVYNIASNLPYEEIVKIISSIK